MEVVSTLKINENQFWSESDPFTVERYIQISKYCQEGNVVLEIGCNTGRGGAVLINRIQKLEIVGIDIIQDRLNKIPSGIYKSLACKSILEFDSDLKFDRIIAGEVIEHIPKYEFELMLLKCKELLRDNGLIIFTTPNPESLLVKLGRKAVFNDPSHVNLMKIDDFKMKIQRSGLKIIKLQGSGKMTRYLKNWPFMSLYGSYLSVLTKGISI